MKTQFQKQLIVLAWMASVVLASAQPTAFTYQGRLTDNSQPANGSYDFHFYLRDAGSNGNPVGTTNTIAPVAVSNGLFTVTLDFGSGIFTGPDRWLEIGVRTNGSLAAYSILIPRQQITSAPYAFSAKTAASAYAAPWSGLTGLPGGFADGVDNDTTYSAGNGLSLGGGNLFSVLYAGSGSSTSAARSDHDHLGQSWSAAVTRGLSLTTTLSSGSGVAGLLGRQGAGSGQVVTTPSGLWGDSSGGYGVLGTTMASSGHGVDGRNSASSGAGVGVYGSSGSSSGFGVYGENSTGVAIKAAGSGIIQSSAHSYFFVPGGLLQKGIPSSPLQLEYHAYGADVYSGGFVGNTSCLLPIAVPAVLYGQRVTVQAVTVYYRCENGANNYITSTALSQIISAHSAATIVTDPTDYTSNVAASYTLVPSNLQLSSASGALTVSFTLLFANATDYISIAGVRVELSHE